MAYEEELNVARAAAREAGAVALEYQRKGVTPESKADDSPVTIADKESEKLISTMLGEAFPKDGLLGEEGAHAEARSGRRWIIDPIDGTRDFVRGNPLWGVLIGLEEAGEVVAGVAHFPSLGRTYWASKDGGSFRDGQPIRISEKKQVQESVLLVNGLSLMRGTEMGNRLMPRLALWMQDFWAVRSLGGSLDACMVASGEAEVWIEPKVAPWDLAAHKIILKEAGAAFFALDGTPTIYGGNAVACVPALEAVVRKFLEMRI
jgi:histidinol phosphatase-like enzyme (inositol monophosphatase family)